MTEPRAESPPLLSAGRLAAYVIVLAALTAAVVVVCSLIGEYHLTAQVWRLRLMRLGAAAAVGAALAAAGMALQGLLRNPLAEPYILGISSGAGVGVLIGTALAAERLSATGAVAAPVAPSWATTPVLAFLGAGATCLVVYGIAQRRGRLDPYVLLLSGVIVNTFNGAIMLAVLMFLDPYRVATFARWGMGELPYVYDPGLLAVCAVLIAAGWVFLFVRSAWMNALGLGDDVAASSGVGVHRLRIETFFVVAAMTSAAVSLAGPIGFLGLVVPHLCRMVVGPDHRRLVIVSGFAGAIFLVLVETLCRTIGPAMGIGDIPAGIVTALCGGPFFVYLLRKRAGGGP